MQKLTIIILTHNSSKIILHNLSRLNPKKHKIIIVDNASKDQTINLIKKNFPQIEIIANQKNIGFARANNIALKKVVTDFALILNPDAFISDADIEKILETIKNKPKIALASGLNYNCDFDSKEIKNESVCQISKKNLLKDCGQYHQAKFITGACLFMRMEIFKKIGFFDENFFLYCEDNELNKRTKKAGYELAIIKDTKFYHLGSKSSELPNPETAYFIMWHRLGWSKTYFTQAVHNKFIAKLKAIRNIFRSLIKICCDLIKNQKINITNKAILDGNFAYLIGKKAFDKNGNPYGIK